MRALLLALLAGCSTSAELTMPPLTEKYEVDEINIRWVRGFTRQCGGLPSPGACAEWSHGRCTITMPKDSSPVLIAEEFLHCFGYVHQ